jgi:hypothetical protein
VKNILSLLLATCQSYHEKNKFRDWPILFKNVHVRLYMVMHAYSSSIGEVEAKGSRVPSQPEQHRRLLSQNKTNNNNSKKIYVMKHKDRTLG